MNPIVPCDFCCFPSSGTVLEGCRHFRRCGIPRGNRSVRKGYQKPHILSSSLAVFMVTVWCEISLFCHELPPTLCSAQVDGANQSWIESTGIVKKVNSSFLEQFLSGIFSTVTKIKLCSF